MKTQFKFYALLLLVVSLMVPSMFALAQDAATEEPVSSSSFYDQAEYDRQMSLLAVEPEGPADQPWLQALEPAYVDTTAYATEGPWTVCFSNAGLFNPWRVVGFTTMEATLSTFNEI